MNIGELKEYIFAWELWFSQMVKDIEKITSNQELVYLDNSILVELVKFIGKLYITHLQLKALTTSLRMFEQWRKEEKEKRELEKEE
jgi:hypothetical protein